MATYPAATEVKLGVQYGPDDNNYVGGLDANVLAEIAGFVAPREAWNGRVVKTGEYSGKPTFAMLDVPWANYIMVDANEQWVLFVLVDGDTARSWYGPTTASPYGEYVSDSGLETLTLSELSLGGGGGGGGASAHVFAG